MNQNSFLCFILQQKLSVIRVYTQVIWRAFWRASWNFPAFKTSLKFGYHVQLFATQWARNFINAFSEWNFLFIVLPACQFTLLIWFWSVLNLLHVIICDLTVLSNWSSLVLTTGPPSVMIWNVSCLTLLRPPLRLLISNLDLISIHIFIIIITIITFKICNFYLILIVILLNHIIIRMWTYSLVACAIKGNYCYCCCYYSLTILYYL